MVWHRRSNSAHGEQMSNQVTREVLSRIDKLFMDRQGMSPKESQLRREQHGLTVSVGDDLGISAGLQLTLLTAINLGVRCFRSRVAVHASAGVWLSPCLVSIFSGMTVADAVSGLGGTPTVTNGSMRARRHLLLGNAQAEVESLRATYDGWCVAVGPADELPRLAERETCSLASIAAAAIGISELFAEFAGLRITAARQLVTLSLWRPDCSIDDLLAQGPAIHELPESIGAFGLGHLGQAYIWGLATLPFSDVSKVNILLCDDDKLETANVETGALLMGADVGRLKTRFVSGWLETRGFSTRLLERRVDGSFRRTDREPRIALSGFDDNQARQWLSDAGFAAVFDSGLGGEAANFDTIAYRTWPNPRTASELWPIETEQERAERELRRLRDVTANEAYRGLQTDECGRVLIAGASIAVPFVGAVAACIVLAEMLKRVNGDGPTLDELKVRLCTLGTVRPVARLNGVNSAPIRGLALQAARQSETS